MRKLVLIIFITAITNSGCNSQTYLEFTDQKSVLNFYSQYSRYTNPGKYEFLYKNLPDSLPELCRLINTQFMHIVAEYPSYKHIMPSQSPYDISNYTTIEMILEKLHDKDTMGLTLQRKPENRLVMGCQNYALLLASMLKYKGIPSRVRYGHATYLIPDFHASHVICEVWNKSEKRWMLVDPNVNRIDFNRDQFDFSNEAWLQMRKYEIDSSMVSLSNGYFFYTDFLTDLKMRWVGNKIYKWDCNANEISRQRFLKKTNKKHKQFIIK